MVALSRGGESVAVWFVLDIPGMRPEQSEAVLKDLGLTDRPAQGQILHVEGPAAGGGMRVADIWESEDAFNRFFQERLMPAFQRAGVQMPEGARPEFMPASHLLK